MKHQHQLAWFACRFSCSKICKQQHKRQQTCCSSLLFGENILIEIDRLERLSQGLGRKCFDLTDKLWLGDLSSWYLATATMKACANAKLEWKTFRINNQQRTKIHHTASAIKVSKTIVTQSSVWLHSAWTLRKINFSLPSSWARFQFFTVSKLMTQQTHHQLAVKTDASRSLHFISFTFEYLHHLLPGDEAEFEFHLYHVHYLLLKTSAGYENKKKSSVLEEQNQTS